MKILQCNIQSINTSLPLLKATLQQKKAEVLLLQEIWRPDGNDISIFNFNYPIMKVRSGKGGGGVAILTHVSVKTVHLPEFDHADLEAVWAEVMVDKVRCVVGSVYIPPGDVKALDYLDEVVGSILKRYCKVLIAMDSNSRNVLWDDTAVLIPNGRLSIRMGRRLEQIMDKYDLVVHNSGAPTYESGGNFSAPDVTLSSGIVQSEKVCWSICDASLLTPHEAILIEVGNAAIPEVC